MADAEATMELDLTIHASSLPAPSGRFSGIEIGSGGSQLGFEDPGRCAISVTSPCDSTSTWDCTAPWVCG